METPPATGRILVVEDEEPLRFTLAHNLRREGYDVITAARGDDALRLAREERPDLVILDLMLPGVDGIQVCRLLRRDTAVPIIMLTALAGEADRVVGLDAGADDYVSKPFGMRELLARVRARLRRPPVALPGERPPMMMMIGDLEILLDRREVRRAGLPLRLKPREYELLLFFAQNAGRILSREQIHGSVWGHDFSGGARTVDVHVRWLREKIEDDPAKPRRLLTVRGSGYRFER